MNLKDKIDYLQYEHFTVIQEQNLKRLPIYFFDKLVKEIEGDASLSYSVYKENDELFLHVRRDESQLH